MIVLIGFMGAGKTTIGRLVADRLALPFADSDVVIEQRTGCQISDIFAEGGEPAFREVEHETIAGLLDGQEAVLALGGGAPEHPGTRRLLADSKADVIYLRVGYEQALARVVGDPYRPLLAAPGLGERYERRLGLYASTATLTVATDGRRPEEIGREIIEYVLRAPPG